MEIFIVFLIFYLLPAILAYFIIRRDFQTKYKIIKPTFSDFLFVVVPYLNVAVVLGTMVSYVIARLNSTLSEKNGKNFFQRFFRL